MQNDGTKVLLLVALGVLALVLLNAHRANTLPVAANAVPGETDPDQSMMSPTWAANVPNIYPPPLSFMMPTVATQGANGGDMMGSMFGCRGGC